MVDQKATTDQQKIRGLLLPVSIDKPHRRKKMQKTMGTVFFPPYGHTYTFIVATICLESLSGDHVSHLDTVLEISWGSMLGVHFELGISHQFHGLLAMVIYGYEPLTSH